MGRGDGGRCLVASPPSRPCIRKAGDVKMDRKGRFSMKKHVIVVCVLLALGAAAAPASVSPSPSCVLQARQELQTCKAECINDFRNERFVCLNVEPGCGRECLGRRESCIEIATAPLDECIGGCRTTLQASKDSCARTCGENESCRDSCVDQAQVDAFVCRDNCHESFRTGGGEAAVEACRQQFRGCVLGCPPAH